MYLLATREGTPAMRTVGRMCLPGVANSVVLNLPEVTGAGPAGYGELPAAAGIPKAFRRRGQVRSSALRISVGFSLTPRLPVD